MSLDDLDILDFETLTESSTDMLTIDELEEYEPKLPKSLMPVDDVPRYDDELAGYFEIVDSDDSLSLIDLFKDDDVEDKPKKKKLKPEEKIGAALTTEMQLFLRHYMSTGTVTGALRNAKVPTSRYRRWMERSPTFAQAILDSTDAIADRLEAEAFKQALSGNTKVLLKSLEALRPSKWGKSSTVNTFLEGKMKVEVTNWAELSQKAEEVIDITPKLEGSD